MSQWENIVQRGHYDAVAGIYLHFPISVRGALSVWLEEHLASSQLNPEVDHEHCFQGFMMQMLNELDRTINAIMETEHHWLTYKRVLQEGLEFIKQHYEYDPKSLFRTLKYCMEQERNLLNPPIPENLGAAGIMMSLKSRMASTSPLGGCWTRKEVVLQELMLLSEDMLDKRQRITAIDEDMNRVSNGIAHYREPLLQERAITQDDLLRKNYNFNKAMMELGQLQKDILMQLESLNEDVTRELDQWIIEQRRAANGFPIERNLDEIESLYVYIAQGLIQLYTDIVKAEKLQQSAVDCSHTEYPVEVHQIQRYVKERILNMVRLIVKKTFLVEVQPYQVIRSKAAPTKQRQSTVTNSFIRLRLLVGNALNPSLIVPVKAELISEKEARKYFENPKSTLQSKIKLVNSQSDLSCNTKTQKCIAEFRGVALANKIERRTKKSQKVTDALEQEFVAAEKWCFLFRGQFTVFEESILIETSSNPVCITCHPNQDYISWGSLLWDNEFAELNRAPFEVPSVVDCNRLLNVISQKFHVHTGRGLTSDNLRFLSYKLTGNSPPTTGGQVSWELFNKRPVTTIKTKKGDKTVTFWEYIYDILKLCEQSTDPKKANEANQHFQKYWAEGKVEGFIFREEMEQKLRESNCDGTFMLRFSDHCPGSVTVNFNYKLQWDIQKFEPYSLEDLTKGLPLWNRILKKPCLTYLYPNIPKEQAFPEPQTQKIDSSKSHLYRLGYIRTFMEEKIDTSGLRSRNVSASSSSTNTSHFTSSFSSALTPHSVTSPQSPPGGYQDSSNNSTTQDYQSSTMDETMDVFKAIREAGIDFDDLRYDMISD